MVAKIWKVYPVKNSSPDNEFAISVRKMRKSLNLDTVQFADGCGVPVFVIDIWESGKGEPGHQFLSGRLPIFSLYKEFPIRSHHLV